MKSKSINQLMILLLVIGIFLQTGCRSLQTSDYYPSSIKLNCPLLPLESLIDFNSFEKIYQLKSTSGLEILCQPQQDFNHIYINDATTVINEDIKQNFSSEPSDKKGYLVFKVKKIEGKSLGFWSWLSACTLTIPWIFGAPVNQYKFEIWMDVDVRNMKNENIATYSGYGKKTASLGYYYGCKQYYQKANIEAMKQALDEAKQKISTNCNTLTLALNKSMNEIQQERDIANRQSKFETDQLMKGNNLFDEKDYTSSMKFYNDVLEKYPNHIFALMNRGRAQSALGSNVAAIKDFTRIIELDPKNVEAYYYRGVAYGNLLELNAAIYNYNKTIKLSPNMAQAYLMRATAEEDLGLNAAAVKDYQEVLKINSDLTFAKERVSIVQDRIQQKQLQQQQQLQQDRINKLNALNAALNNLSNTLNAVSNNNTSGSNNSTVNTSNSSNLTLKQKTCTNCNGTGISPGWITVAAFGSTAEHWCNDCKRMVSATHGGHPQCPICKGKKYIESY